MNKPEWIKAVATKLEQPEDQVALILETELEEIYQALKREEKVTLVNFGTFYIDVRRSGTCFQVQPISEVESPFWMVFHL
jgi:nucleoid DNA-binding protein